MRKTLFTIGEVAKIKQVNAKSLRYYERIGILKPAKIDPETKYRYYTQQQLDLVGLIQLCVELDIPLKLLKQFSDSEGGNIELGQLFPYSKAIAKAKIAKLQQSLAYLESFEHELAENKALCAPATISMHQQPETKYYYCLELASFPTIPEYWLHFQVLQTELNEQRFTRSYEHGIIVQRIAGESYRYYQFMEIQAPQQQRQKQILVIPQGNYSVEIMAESEVIARGTDHFFEREPRLEMLIFTEYVLGTFNIESFHFKIKSILSADFSSNDSDSFNL